VVCLNEGALNCRPGKARAASLVGAAKSARLNGRPGKARAASLVGAAKSAP
jgi:hypothetical protein